MNNHGFLCLLLCFRRLFRRFSILDWWQVCRRLWASGRIVQSVYWGCHWKLYNRSDLSATLFNCVSVCWWILWRVCIVRYNMHNCVTQLGWFSYHRVGVTHVSYKLHIQWSVNFINLLIINYLCCHTCLSISRLFP